MIAPTFRSRLGQPSSLLPIPVELSTVEWQDAQVRPIDFKFPLPSNFPTTPTTAFILINSRVAAGSSRNLPSLILLFKKPGRLLRSTFKPAAHASLGDKPLPVPPCLSSAIAL